MRPYAAGIRPLHRSIVVFMMLNGTVSGQSNISFWEEPKQWKAPEVDVAGFWNQVDKGVFVYSRWLDDENLVILARILAYDCGPVTREIAVGGATSIDYPEPLQVRPQVTAYGNGFIVVWSGEDEAGKAEVYYRAFDANGTPLTSVTKIDTSPNDEGRYAPRIAGAVWAPSGSGVRPAFYALVTWLHQRVENGVWLEYPEMKLFKGINPPIPITGVLRIAGPAVLVGPAPQFYGRDGVSADFFTECGTDLRVGVAWAFIDFGPLIGWVAKRFFRFVPGTTGSSVGSGTDLVMGDEIGDEAGLSTVWTPGILIDNPGEPDVMLPPATEQ